MRNPDPNGLYCGDWIKHGRFATNWNDFECVCIVLAVFSIIFKHTERAAPTAARQLESGPSYIYR